VRRWLPAPREATENIAAPFARVAVAMVAPPSFKVIVPFGTPLPGATTATATENVRGPYTALPDNCGVET
jgi:hypothetical protein